VIRRAQCACGGLSVEAEGEPQVVSACHCLECQRRTGSAFGLAAFYARESVHPSGPASVYVRKAESDNSVVFHFCPTCGTTLYWEREGAPERVGIAVGGFADPGFPPPARSVYEHRKLHWLELPPALDRPW